MNSWLNSSNVKAIIKLSPLLILYVAIILATQTDEFRGDEGGYISFATNLTHGYYSPRGDVDLWWGPGYPIILAPFVFFKAPLLIPKLLNAAFLFYAVIYFYQTLRLYTDGRYLLLFTYLFGLYPPFLRLLGYIWTETLAVLLISGLLYHFCKVGRERTHAKMHQVLAGLYLGYLALTKVFFGYVILASLIISLLVLVFRTGHLIKKAALVCCIALVVCLPYLCYTYSLTNKIFYWSNSGGLQLYWMSSPYSEELGDWQFRDPAKGRGKAVENHLALFERVSKLPAVERDDAFKRAAIQNIAHHPFKYFTNWLANVGRLFFDYPYSYAPQTLRTYFYMIPNLFIFAVSLLTLYPAWQRRYLTPSELHLLVFFTILATAGESLLSAYARLFWILTPIIDVFIISVLSNSRIAIDVPATGHQKFSPVPSVGLRAEGEGGSAKSA
jgi:hypothetical protein